MSPTHKAICSNGALTTADYLMMDCVADEIPEDPDVLRDFGFEHILAFNERSKLLGLYKGLMYLEVRSEELHSWQVSGSLANQIIEIFERRPVESRGGYFPWFVKNRNSIFPSTPPSLTEDDMLEQLSRSAKFLLQPSDRFQPVKDLQPDYKRSCFMFAALVVQSQHPPPELVGPYYDFGFRACMSGAEEKALGVLYQQLIIGDIHHPRQLYWGDMPNLPVYVDRFSQFCQAFAKGTLIQLMEDNGLKEQMLSIRHLEMYLDGSTEIRNLPVWDLLTFLKTGDAELPPDEIFIPFKFIRCIDLRVKIRLKHFYTSLLALVDILQLQEAQAAGRLLEFAKQHMEVGPDLAEILEVPEIKVRCLEIPTATGS